MIFSSVEFSFTPTKEIWKRSKIIEFYSLIQETKFQVALDKFYNVYILSAKNYDEEKSKQKDV